MMLSLTQNCPHTIIVSNEFIIYRYIAEINSGLDINQE